MPDLQATTGAPEAADPTTAHPTAAGRPRPEADHRPEETTVRLDSVADLLATIETLPSAARSDARARVDAALERPAREARMALGLLALDLAGTHATPPAEVSRVIHLPDPTAPVAASA